MALMAQAHVALSGCCDGCLRFPMRRIGCGASGRWGTALCCTGHLLDGRRYLIALPIGRRQDHKGGRFGPRSRRSKSRPQDLWSEARWVELAGSCRWDVVEGPWKAATDAILALAKRQGDEC